MPCGTAREADAASASPIDGSGLPNTALPGPGPEVALPEAQDRAEGACDPVRLNDRSVVWGVSRTVASTEQSWHCLRAVNQPSQK